MARQADEAQSMKNVSGGGNVERSTATKTYDQNAFQERMQKLREEIDAKNASEKKKAAERAAVPVDDADVAIVAKELGCTTEEARDKLQGCRGNLTATLCEAVGIPTLKQ